MKELIAHIVKAIVDYPEQVEIIETNAHQTTVFELKVAKSDLGKLIGKQGRNINAIRVIIGAASARSKKRILLEIQEDKIDR